MIGFGLSPSLSFIPGQGDGSSTRSSPGSSTGVLDRFDTGGWPTTPAEPDLELDNVIPEALAYSLAPLHRGVWTKYGGVPPTSNAVQVVVGLPIRYTKNYHLTSNN